MAPLRIWALVAAIAGSGSSVLAAPVVDGTASTGYDYVRRLLVSPCRVHCLLHMYSCIALTNERRAG
jgi:hypothetical protein